MYYVYSIFNVLQSSIMAYLVAQTVKNLLANAGDARDLDSILGSGRSPEVGNGNPLQDCLGNPTDGRAWRL